jgi:hypothetical protein
MAARIGFKVGVSLAALVAVATFAKCSETEPSGSSSQLLPQRLWVDRMPNDERDMVHKFVLVRSLDHGRFGVSEFGSVWRHHTEVFKWGLHDDRLQMGFPQDRRHVTAKVRTWECEGEAPDGFELCLELRADGRKIRMYSRHDWVVRPRPGDDILDDGPLAGYALPRLVDVTEVTEDDGVPSGLDALWLQ